MPLIKSSSKQAVTKNIKKELAAGKPHDQAVAIALNVKRRARGKAGGGEVSIPYTPIGGGKTYQGFIPGTSGGRTDNKPMKVGSGSYVLPADTLSALGHGNSQAGADALSRMFKMGPYATGKFADGGEVGAPTDIIAASGEMVLPPEKVAEIGGGDLKRGHSILDGLVTHVRRKNISTLRKLPKPKKS